MNQPQSSQSFLFLIILLVLGGAVLVHDLVAFGGLTYAALALGHEFPWASFAAAPVEILRIMLPPVAVAVALRAVRLRRR